MSHFVLVLLLLLSSQPARSNEDDRLQSNNSAVQSQFVCGIDYRGDYRARTCIKDIDQCRREDTVYRQTSDKLVNVLTSLPHFHLDDVAGVSRECRQQSRIYLEELSAFKYWALAMYDAGAKIPSGILNGNVNQFGDFDLCVNSYSAERNVRGQYCLAYFQVEVPRSTYLSGLNLIIMAYNHLKTDIEDSGHRVPRFSTISWAVCVPSACTSDDVEKGLEKVVRRITENTELKIRFKQYPENCHATDKWEVPISTKVAFAIFLLFIVWLVFATLYHHWSFNPENEWIVAFSLKKNITSLITIKPSSDIEILHGIRFLNAVALMSAHKNLASFFEPFANRRQLVEEFTTFISIVGRTASLYTEPFVMISGLLTAKSFLNKLDKTGKINVREEYVNRLFRIVPCLAFLIFFCTFLMPWMSYGPLWNQVVTHHSHICKKNWWRNLLFIHNYFGFGNMCLTHTHHIGIDTQLFFFSPLLVYVLWRWKKRGMLLLLAISAASSAYRFYVTYSMQLSNYILMGASTKQLFATADYSYTQPAHRVTVYIIGIFIAYILKNSKNVRLSETTVKLGNALAVTSFCLAYFGFYHMGDKDYVYNPMDAALYGGVAPILFSFSYAWLIITSELVSKGRLARFFSLKIFRLWTKISYTVYLTQFPIYFYNVGRTRSTSWFNFFSTQYNLKEFIWIIILSALLTVTVEMPFQNLRDIFNKRKTSNAVVENKKKS